jgi:hypothetical protein
MTKATLTLVLALATVAVMMAQEANDGNGLHSVYQNGQLYLQNTSQTQVNAVTATPAGGKVARTILPGKTIPTSIPTSQQVKVYACFAPTYATDTDNGYSAGWGTVNWTCKQL